MPAPTSEEIDQRLDALQAEYDHEKALVPRAIPGIPHPKYTHMFSTPGASVMLEPTFHPLAVLTFLEQFDLDLGFRDYLKDETPLLDPEAATKFLGQLCYLSFGPKRTKNADVRAYFTNILSSSHGSLLQHANYTFLLWGEDRAVTHELVRHAAGCAYSQVSQRYVSGKTLRFVMPYELRDDPEEQGRMADKCAADARYYDELAERLMAKQAQGDTALKAADGTHARTEARKRVNQLARRALPNATEAPIGVTLNVRALRHVLQMRGDGAADVPIRLLAYRIYLLMAQRLPNLLFDAELQDLQDGTTQVSFKYPKV